MLKPGGAELINKEKDCLHQYITIRNAEEAFMKQKSRNLGDQNSSFFHKVIKLRNATNNIRCLYDSAGAEVDELHQLKDLAVDFFKNLVGPPLNVFFLRRMQTKYLLSCKAEFQADTENT